MLRPISFQYAGVWISDRLHRMFDHLHNQFHLVLDLLLRQSVSVCLNKTVTRRTFEYFLQLSV